MREGLLAEFTAPEQLVAAMHAMREHGYQQLDAYTPYPLPETEHALGLRRSRLPVLVFAMAISAAAGAYTLQWYLNGYLYPIDVGGRPPHMPLPYMIITFEMGILFAALTAFSGVLVYARATQLWDPVHEVPGFDRATIDRFFLEVDRRDPLFDDGDTAEHLQELGPLRVVHFGRRQP